MQINGFITAFSCKKYAKKVQITSEILLFTGVFGEFADSTYII